MGSIMVPLHQLRTFVQFFFKKTRMLSPYRKRENLLFNKISVVLGSRSSSGIHDTAVGCDRGPSPATHSAFSIILSVFVRFIIQDLVRAYRSDNVLFINTSIQHLSFSRLSISTCQPPPFTLTIFSLSTFICHNAVSTSL